MGSVEPMVFRARAQAVLRSELRAGIGGLLEANIRGERVARSAVVLAAEAGLIFHSSGLDGNYVEK